jgi:hypothetical protein
MVVELVLERIERHCSTDLSLEQVLLARQNFRTHRVQPQVDYSNLVVVPVPVHPFS